MSLSKTLYPLLGTGSSQISDWDVRNPIKQTKQRGDSNSEVIICFDTILVNLNYQ